MLATAPLSNATAPPAAKAAAAQAGLKALAALSLDRIEIVNFAKGEREVTAAHLFNKGVKLCFPDMPTGDAPCFFTWMGKKGCAPPAGADAAAFVCNNCKRAKELGKDAVRPPKELLAAIRAAANTSTAGLLKQ